MDKLSVLIIKNLGYNMTVKLEVSGAHASPGILEFIKEIFYLFTILFFLEEFFDFLLTRFLSCDHVAEFAN